MTNQNWHGDKYQDNEQKGEHDRVPGDAASNACLETSCEMSYCEDQDAQSGEQKEIHTVKITGRAGRDDAAIAPPATPHTAVPPFRAWHTV